MAKPIRTVLFIPRAKNVPAWWLGAPQEGFTALAETHKQRMRNCLEYDYATTSGHGEGRAIKSKVAMPFVQMGEDERLARGFELIGGEE